MTVRDTSRQAFATIIPFLGEKQRQVLSVLEHSVPLTNSEIAKELGWGINRVTPRVKELRDMKLLTEMGRRKCGVTGFEVHVWGIPQDTLF